MITKYSLTYLSNLIHNDQTGFIKGRYIGENINQILNIIEEAELQDIPSVMIMIDFEKVFVSLSLSFVIKTLEQLNFGPSITNWVKSLYSISQSCVVNNDWASESFKLQRGVRQGCTLLPYLFILAAEVLSSSIKENDNILVIKIQDIIYKKCQYVDDTILFVPFDVQSINATFYTFEQFQAISGLKVNFNKTKIVPLGPLEEPKMSLYNRGKVKWSQDGVKALRIHITHDNKTLIAKNCNPLIAKIENLFKIWSMRNLSLFHGCV